MIPKIIHYCWFGDNDLPEQAKKCIASWRKYFNGYEIKQWNESNYDVHKIPYISEAYNAKKYAFVSDYARFDILYTMGGIYFDTDVEVIKPYDDILTKGGFMGFESPGKVASGLGLGCNPGLNIVDQILKFYFGIHFKKDDGSYNLETVVEYITKILKKNGLTGKNVIQYLDGFIVYPTDYFNPKYMGRGKNNITKNTRSIHHYDGSWLEKTEKKWISMRDKCIKAYGYNIGKILGFIYFSLICLVYSDDKSFVKELKRMIRKTIKL